MPERRCLLVVTAPLFVLAPRPAAAAQWHVTTDGTAAGDGSRGAPWDLATALAHPASVQPGDTIWLHEGSYPVVGELSSILTGTPDAPIVVRAAAGEHVRLDTGSDFANVVAIQGGDTWYWDFEVSSGADDRWAPSWTPDSQIPPARGQSINVYDAPGTKLIGLVVHDTASAIGFWEGAVDAEIYGCLIYFNGFDADDRGHGHGVYTQNLTGTKHLRDNILFGQYSFGIHGYGEGGHLDNFDMEGNISFRNGVVSTISDATTNILIGGAMVAHDPRVAGNATWFEPGEGGIAIDLGYGSVENAIVTDNVAAAATALRVSDVGASMIAGNLGWGLIDGFDPAAFPDNLWYPDAGPAGTTVVLRPDVYDPDRARLAVFNWDAAAEVAVDLAGVLAPGDSFELRDAQDYFGAAVLTGEYDGGELMVPMTPRSVAAIVGAPSTPYVHTSARFGAFVLLRTGTGGGADEGGGSSSDGGVTTATQDGGGDAGGSDGADTTAASTVAASSDEGSGDGAAAGDDAGSGCGCRSEGRRGDAVLPLVVFALWRRRHAGERGRPDRVHARPQRHVGGARARQRDAAMP